MRAASASAAALALLAAGCTVQTEGAPCLTSDNCPAGQGCGVGPGGASTYGRCAARAVACASCARDLTRCQDDGTVGTCQAATDGLCFSAWAATASPGPHQVCEVGPGGAATLVCRPSPCRAVGPQCAAGNGSILTCASDSQGCFFESATATACTGGLQCGAQGNGVGCGCPDPGGVFRVDAAGGSTEAASPAPTGADAPSACRFKTLAAGLNAAARRVATPGATATVLAVGRAAGETQVFAEDLREVQAGVTLSAGEAVPFSGAAPYAIEVKRPLVLHDGATLSGFEVRPAADATDGMDGIVTSCAAGATQPAIVQDARVLGASNGHQLGVGVHQVNACPLVVLRTRLEANGVAVQASSRGVTVDASQVVGGQTGIQLDGQLGTGTSVIQGTTITGTSDTGIRVLQGADSTLTLEGNTVTGNCATTAYSVVGGTRRGGGIVFRGALPALTFKGNRVYANGWDQVLVVNSTGSLSLVGDDGASAVACPASGKANHFACLDAPRGVGVYSSGATVTATGNYWHSDPPDLNADFFGPVDYGEAAESYCGASPLQQSCPAITCP